MRTRSSRISGVRAGGGPIELYDHANDAPEIENFVWHSWGENPDVPDLWCGFFMYRVPMGIQSWVCDGHVDGW